MYYYSREKEEKRKHRRERERSERFFFFLAQKPNNVVLIKSSRAHSARHEFISFTIHLVIIIAKKKRELSFVTLSLSLCSLSLSLSVFLLLLFVFTFHPQKWAVDTKIKTLFPPLSLVWTKVYAHHRLKCYNCVIKGLHEYFIGNVTFFCHHRRALSLLRPYEREREREREKKKEREERAKTTDENFVSTKYAKRGKKTSRCYCFSAATREREREAQKHVA